jgi:hypothetical protein
MKNLILLQLFAEGSAGAGATGSESSGADGAEAGSRSPKGQEDLSTVVYGKPSGEIANPTNGKSADAETPEQKEARFQELIKGEFKDVYAKRTQAIIDDRFKKFKGVEEQLNKVNPILQVLADKYGSDADDVEGLLKAVEEDESFYQKAAIEKGLTVKQYKEIRALERQNEELKKAQEAKAEQENTERIYNEWMGQAQEFSEKFGIDVDLGAEIQNPDFARLLSNGVTVEGAYKAVHFDDMVGGAMAHTAEKVKESLVNSINGRSARPSEAATASNNGATFKTDVSKLTKADREEIERRAARGEIISF